MAGRYWCASVMAVVFLAGLLGAGAGAQEILPGLRPSSYPATSSPFGGTTPVATTAPPVPMPPGSVASSGSSVSADNAFAAPAPQSVAPQPASPQLASPELRSPKIEPTPQIISSAPPSEGDDIGFSWGPPPRPRGDFYARVDYFTWKEFINSAEVVEETGPLVSVGYLREGLHSRIRAELFGGTVNYDGETMDGVPLYSDTGYFGGRFDIDLLARHYRPRGFVELFAGLGTRIWQRDLKSGWDEIGRPVISYQEDWWTVYFTGGLSISHAVTPNWELYATARAGLTIFTRQRVSLWEDYLQPNPGFTGAMEMGMRGKHLAVALRMETMAWAESDEVATFADGYWWSVFQPKSEMSTVGLSLAYTY